MEIHKPKAVHSWRDFLSEIGVVVLLHWRHQVKETETGLTHELASNIAKNHMLPPLGTIG
jgi:hypothetical protein